MWCLIAFASSGSAADDLFDQRVHPILAGKCFRCHGGERVSGSLRVDGRDALLKGGDSGPALVPGDAEQSLLIKAVRRADDVSAMPPDKPLRPDEIKALASWIEAGAPWPTGPTHFAVKKHWAFEPLGNSAPPAVRAASWPQTSVDRFILAAQEAAGIGPAPKADRRTLLRRATYDLTGLPPTPEEVTAFENDPSESAWDAVIDRLLASPHYGEHWGRHWLDVVRYADTAGENSDHPLPHAWRYRNWVIRAFNDDKHYDEFVREQVAGDLLAADEPQSQTYADRVVATGYLAIARRFGHDIEQEMHLTYEDTIDTLGKSLLGLSLGCCRCHDHKYDPLSTRDYYGLYGILASSRFPFPGCEPKQQPRDLVPLLTPDQIDRGIAPWRQQIATVQAEIDRVAQQQAPASQQFRQAAAQSARVLSSGQIDDGGAADPTAGEPGSLTQIDVKRGDVLQLSITPRGNHGADSTLVELEISTLVGETRQWTTADLVDDLTADNPHADRFGNAAAWYFLEGAKGGDGAGPQLLREGLPAINGKAELRCWRNGDTPSVFVNVAQQPVAVWTQLPPRAFFMHPGPQGPVVLAWVSPVESRIAVRCHLADAHPGGGDGVGWLLEHVSSAGAAGALQTLGDTERQRRSLQRRRDELAAREPPLPVAYAVVEGTARDAAIQRRGEPNDPGEEVPRKFPDVLGGQTVRSENASGRRELADWLTDRDNPLAARVMVNRIWQWHFGRGLVATSNDFGSRGSLPSHPELLDHLARAFTDGGWSVKSMHRLILRSATYCQASAADDGGQTYVSFRRRRLTAEEVRDTLLSVAGGLDASPGMEHPFPGEATWSFSQHAPFAAEYETARRSVYVMQKRNRRGRFFALFDGADPNASTPRRDVTTVPTQALFFLNDPFLHQCAQRLAARIVRSSSDDGERIELACRLLFGRSATAADRADAADFLSAFAAQSTDPHRPEFVENAWTAYARVLLGSNEFLHVD
ncbi:MAG TPA: PSD1 and planctomycete cytochrome C domain-containing protein [Pirellulales bacterium]|nr:PSD1 and planctomycete cytochrome C domain-containing protein [Pirellulales bacterium]